MSDLAVSLNAEVLTDEFLYKRLKEEMVGGFTGMPHNKYRMLLLAAFYQEVFYF